MQDQTTARLIELRTQLDVIERAAADADYDGLNAHVNELIQLYNELCDIYASEKEVFHGLESISWDQEETLNAVEETLEAAQETTHLMISRLRDEYPGAPDPPAVVAFEETVEQMRDEVDRFSHEVTGS